LTNSPAVFTQGRRTPIFHPNRAAFLPKLLPEIVPEIQTDH